MLKQQQARMALLQTKLGKLLKYAGELEHLIQHSTEVQKHRHHQSCLRWHLYFKSRQFEHEALKLVADALAVISKEHADLADKVLHVSIVTQTVFEDWHAVRLEFPDYRDKRTL